MVTRVYKFTVQDGFEWVLPLEEDDYEIFRRLDGTPRRDSWIPIPVQLLHHDEAGRSLAESDMPWLGAYAPVLRPRSVSAIGELFSRFGEFLPLQCDEAGLQVFNTLRVIDALDMERSNLTFYPNSARIMQIKRYAFIGDVVEGVMLFKVPQLMSHAVYLTGEVVRAVQEARLNGVGFRLLWDDAARG